MLLRTWVSRVVHTVFGHAERRRRRLRKLRAVAHHRLTMEPLESRQLMSATPHDFLLVGDGGDDTVKRFDATTGAYLGTFVASESAGLHGPRGIVLDGHKLLLVNQNVNTDFNGEVLRYDDRGAPLPDLVPAESPTAPFAPRGIVVKGRTAYVADVVGPDGSDGRVARYDVKTGKSLGDLAPSPTSGFPGQFNPRGVVFGPDGALYVAVFDLSNPQAGHVVRFNPKTGAWRLFATNDGDGIDEPGETRDLHRPEGLVFGPDGRLYVTSYQANAADNDKILIFNGRNGQLVDKIDVDAPGLAANGNDLPRAIPQALLFGPGGDLFVPITNAVGPSVATYDSGAIRRYHVNPKYGPQYKTFTYFVQPHDAGGALAQPWYLTFGQTNADTLSYPGGRAEWVGHPKVAAVCQALVQGQGLSGSALLPATAVTIAPTGSTKATAGQLHAPATPSREVGSMPGTQTAGATVVASSSTGMPGDPLVAGLEADLVAPALKPLLIWKSQQEWAMH